MKILNLIMLIITFISIFVTIYYIYNFCTNLDVFEYNNITYTKTLLLIGGVHGNEQSGAIFLLGLKQQFDNNEINIPNTRVIILPYVNKCGVITNLRNLLFFTDINRNFTDDTKNSINIKILKYVKMIKDTDLIIDIHEGYDFHRINYNSIGSTLYASTQYALNIINKIYNPLNNTIDDPNKKFKLLTYDSNLVKQDRNKYSLMNEINGTLDYYTYKNNINYILIEITGQNNKQPIELRISQLVLIFAEIFKYM
jgi:hypothetical protein